jgi:hypothetical protein
VQYYQMGEDVWLMSHSWQDIPRTALSLYLQPGGLLSESLPPEGEDPARYTYDPADPTPALGGSRFNPFDPALLVGPQDLGPVESRPDVQVYSTPPLTHDLRLNGSVRAELFVSSDRTDTDFCVRLADVYPDGRSVIVTQGIRRMRFRNGYDLEELMVPGQVYAVVVELQDLALTFEAGHRLRIAVSSADYPHFDKNRNDGGPTYGPGPSFTAVNAVFHDARHPSRLALSVLPVEPLAADFVWVPEHPSAGERVTLTALPAGGTPPYTCTWDLAGTAAVGTTVETSLDAGDHLLGLTVQDGAGTRIQVEHALHMSHVVAVTGVTIQPNPFRLEVLGVGFQEGCAVEIDAAAVPRTIYKDAARVIAKGEGLKAMVPKGIEVALTVVNADGSRSGPFPVVR